MIDKPLLMFITGYQEAHHGVSPSFDEMCAAIGMGRQAVTDRLNELERRKYIRRLPNRARAIEVVRYVEIPRGPEGEPMMWIEVKHG